MKTNNVLNLLRASNSLPRTLGVASVVVSIWVASIALLSNSNVESMSRGDLAAVLFGAASLALFMLSLIFAVAATIGLRALLETARALAAEANEPFRHELMGRLLSFQGHVLGRLSLDADTLRLEDKEMLQEALGYCQLGFDHMKQVGGQVELMALNNLIFYSMIAKDHLRGDFLLRGARTLLEKGQEYNSLNFQLTGCGVILLYSNDREERRKAYELLAEIARNERATRREKREAKYYLDTTPEP